MFAVTRRHGGLAALALLFAAPALAVGLGPLRKSGITDGPGKAFYLSISNPYPDTQRFALTPYLAGADLPAARVRVVPADVMLAPAGRRRVIVVVTGLQPGEEYPFRVCAQRAARQQESVHARVCSKLAARRLAARP